MISSFPFPLSNPILQMIDVPLPSLLPSTPRFLTSILEHVPLCCAGKFHVRMFFFSSKAGWEMERRRNVLLSWLILIFCKYFRLALAFSFSNNSSHSEFKPKEYWSKNTIIISLSNLASHERINCKLIKTFLETLSLLHFFQAKRNFAPSKGSHLIGYLRLC